MFSLVAYFDEEAEDVPPAADVPQLAGRGSAGWPLSV